MAHIDIPSSLSSCVVIGGARLAEDATDTVSVATASGAIVVAEHPAGVLRLRLYGVGPRGGPLSGTEESILMIHPILHAVALEAGELLLHLHVNYVVHRRSRSTLAGIELGGLVG